MMFRILRLTLLLWMAVSGVLAQVKRTRLDVQHYTIDADINPRTQAITAAVKIDFNALEPGTDAIFELNNALTVSKAVDRAGQSLSVSRNDSDFTVRFVFPTPMGKDQPNQITVNYEGKLTGNEDGPISGIKFAALHPESGYLLYPARWFPVNGYTSDRFSADLHLSVPGEYRAVASGDMKSDRASNGRTTFSFHYEHESFPGSIAIVKSDGKKVTSGGINSTVYFSEAHSASVQPYGEEIGKIMAFLTSQYGLAPQANLSIVETEAGAVNGYSAPGVVFLSSGAITEKVNGRVLANQLSRQWWGMLVSPMNRNHLWLCNGPARYSELLYINGNAGAGNFDEELRNTYVEALTVRDPPVIQASRLEDYSPEYWALTAAKGAAVLNMLRNAIGEANYKKGMQQFLDQYSWKSVTTEDFRKTMEAVSGQELRYFFIQWLESSGSPEFKLEYTVFRTQKGFRVVGKINQDLDTFRMPVDLKIETEGNPEEKKIEVTGTSSEFSVDTFGKPKKLTLDPNHVLLRIDPVMQVAVAIRRGEQFVEIGDYSNALREYEKALDVSKANSLAHYRIGELFFRQNNFSQAANEFRAAINGDLDPKWTEVWAHINLGKIFDATGQRDRAVNEYKLAIRTRDNTGGAQDEAAKYSTKPYEPKNTDV